MGRGGWDIRKKVLHKFHSYSPPPGAVGSCEESIKRTGGITHNSTLCCTTSVHQAQTIFNSRCICALQCIAVEDGEGVLYIIHRVSGSQTSTASSPNHRHLHAFPPPNVFVSFIIYHWCSECREIGNWVLDFCPHPRFFQILAEMGTFTFWRKSKT